MRFQKWFFALGFVGIMWMVAAFMFFAAFKTDMLSCPSKFGTILLNCVYLFMAVVCVVLSFFMGLEMLTYHQEIEWTKTNCCKKCGFSLKGLPASNQEVVPGIYGPDIFVCPECGTEQYAGRS